MKSLLFLVFMLPCVAFSQTESNWSVFSVDASINVRNYRYYRNGHGLGDYVKNRQDLENPDNIFYPISYLSNDRASGNFSLNVGLNTKKQQRKLNVGVNYTTYGFQAENALEGYDVVTIDTFEFVDGNGNATPILADSVWLKREYLSLEQKVLSISADYVMRTERTRLAGYIGVGGQLGVSLVNEMYYGRVESWRSQYTDTNGVVVYQPQTMGASQVFPSYDEQLISNEYGNVDAKMEFILTPFVPLGIEYTPFINKEKLSKIGIEMRGKVGTEFHFMRGTEIRFRPFFSFGFGLKYFV